ncbi:hypothetical protein [Paenibacillus sp. CAA11]|uniref:hypothetical protein n=1 Tax=Paenibacillus sp. CAA11 TaxID=1532905 RepID=UPI00131F1B93|nr:hypothetical protein [Paenibacillus sp. CAA11]
MNMIDKINKVSNPLTIIAIFAGIAEVAATVALGLIAAEVQRVFIWFVMLFPILLVLSFFVTLWYRPQALYAPSDYRDEDNFMKNMNKANDIVENTVQQIKEFEIEPEMKNKVISNLYEVKEVVNNFNKSNNRLISLLKTIEQHAGISREEILTETSLTVSEVDQLLSMLINQQAIEVYKEYGVTKFKKKEQRRIS